MAVTIKTTCFGTYWPLRWFYKEACSSSSLLIGVVYAVRPESDLGGTVTYPVGGRDMCDPIAPLARTHHRISNVQVTYYAMQSGCRDLSITCTHIIYSRTI